MQQTAKGKLLPSCPGQARFLVKRILLTMKLIIVLLTLFNLHVAAGGKAQLVSLSCNNEAMEKVFNAIEKQTGFVFIYTQKEIKAAVPVSLDVKNMALQNVLNTCFKNQPLTFSIVDQYIVVRLKPAKTNEPAIIAEIPPIDVKGKIANENGEPVNATVTIKGTNQRTYTNDRGEFELKNVDEKATLVITGVGIESFEIKLEGRTQLQLTAKIKVSETDDVVIEANTGYQRVKPNEVNGTMTVMDNKTLNQQVGLNILERLDGVANGVLFDNKTVASNLRRNNISVRGLSTINGPQDVLIVLDGFIYEGDINNVNPNMVENITILRDAAATSIWGARAGNGVIVITTKRGQFNQKVKVDISANAIVRSKPDFSYLPQMSSTDYINMEEFLYNRGAYNNIIGNINGTALTPVMELLRRKTLGLITSEDSAQQMNALKGVDVRDEFNRHIYRKPFIQQYAVNIRGGSNMHSYILALGYDKSVNEVDNMFHRINARMENVFRPVKNLEVTLGAYYTNGKSVSGRPTYGNINIAGRTVPYLRIADENGQALSVAHMLRDSYTDTAGGGRLLDWKYYPLEDYKHNRTRTGSNEIFTYAGMNYKLFPFLDIDVRYQYQQQQSQSNQLQTVESFAARDLINQFSSLNYSTGIVTYPIPVGGVKSVRNSTTSSQTIRGQLNFNHTFFQHSISAIVGSEIRNAVTEGNSFTIYGYNEDPINNGIVNYLSPYRTFITGATRNIPGAPLEAPTITNRFISLYGNLAYTFKGRYSLSGSVRRDGSNVFGVNTNDRWKPLWSAGLGWNISKEDFYDVDFLPHLKLRATYGYSGNVDLSRSAVPVASYSGGNSSATNLPVGIITTLNNPELRWEQVNTINLGIDYSLKSHVITGSVDYYFKHGSDLYGPVPYDYTAWGQLPTILKNVANMRGNGLELKLNSKNINRQFKWNSTFLFTRQVNKTTKYFSIESNQITQLISDGGRITPVIGKPLYAIAAYRWGGLDESGNPQGYVNNEKSTDYNAIFSEANTKGEEGNVIYMGSALPTVFGNLINTFSYKNITVSVNIGYRLGYYFRKTTISYSDLILSGRGHKDYERRWQNPGDELRTSVPSFVYPNINGRDAFYTASEANVLKGDHIRLQYINLDYSLNKSTWKRNPFHDLSVYMNISNLGVIWTANKEKLDPEYPTTLKPMTSWAFGLRSTFYVEPGFWDRTYIYNDCAGENSIY